MTNMQGLYGRSDAAMEQAGARVTALIHAEVALNPSMPTVWIAHRIFGLTCGPGEVSKFARWASLCSAAQMIAELRGEGPVDPAQFSDDPDVLIAQAEALRAHAAALAAYHDERGAA